MNRGLAYEGEEEEDRSAGRERTRASEPGGEHACAGAGSETAPSAGGRRWDGRPSSQQRPVVKGPANHTKAFGLDPQGSVGGVKQRTAGLRELTGSQHCAKHLSI